MPNTLTGKVAIVTGAGRGIGRGIALTMAAEGAKVVVNDLGGAVDGTGTSSSPADEVVAEINANGGEAVANYNSVATMEGGEAIVQSALDNYGQLDIVVTVAGILRDRMIFNMTEDEWDDVIDVHLKGTFTVVKFASILFRQQRSGRIITFASESGLFGNTGQGQLRRRQVWHSGLHQGGSARPRSLRRNRQLDLPKGGVPNDSDGAGCRTPDANGPP